MLVLIPLATAFVYANMLAPMVTTLVSAQEALCGGNLKFVWTTDARSVVLFSPTQGDGWNDPGLELLDSPVKPFTLCFASAFPSQVNPKP